MRPGGGARAMPFSVGLQGDVDAFEPANILGIQHDYLHGNKDT